MRTTIPAAQLYTILDYEFRTLKAKTCARCRAPMPYFRKPPDDVSANWNIGTPPEFATVGEMEAYFRTIYKPFGWHSPAQWRHMAETSLRRLPGGRITTHYDPAIVRQMFAHPRDYEQWDHYDRISVPTLVLRGAESDLL